MKTGDIQQFEQHVLFVGEVVRALDLKEFQGLLTKIARD